MESPAGPRTGDGADPSPVCRTPTRARLFEPADDPEDELGALRHESEYELSTIHAPSPILTGRTRALSWDYDGGSCLPLDSPRQQQQPPPPPPAPAAPPAHVLQQPIPDIVIPGMAPSDSSSSEEESASEEHRTG